MRRLIRCVLARPWPPVHPCSRRERGWQPLPTAARTGTPPLARGARGGRRRRGPRWRDTPARAGSTRSTASSWACISGHPRSRGEAPPGGPQQRRNSEARGRDTPARAGSTRTRSRTAAPCTGHPRSRGEHCHRYWPFPSLSGTPPLARGARDRTARGVTDSRDTPARAGSTSRCRGPRRRASGHPRSRGEHAAAPVSAKRYRGTPPLALGARTSSGRRPTGPRDTPARAGSTWRPAWCRRRRPGHPRSRGEHTRARGTRASGPTGHPRSRGEHGHDMTQQAGDIGTPPLARGAPLQRDLGRDGVRDTPARAGSTMSPETLEVAKPGHPRSRGEHCDVRGIDTPACGTPPLARGARVRGGADDAEGRDTPARAGSTDRPAAGQHGGSGRPRSRGEHTTTTPPFTPSSGTPPLARGARHPQQRARRLHRDTPARAGSTTPAR